MTRKVPRSSISFAESKVLTKQYFKDECDINNIIGRFQSTGLVPVSNRLDPQYGDAPTIDFKDALDTVLNARYEFDSLKPDIRDRFNNDEREYYQFLADFKASPEAYALLNPDSIGGQKLASDDGGVQDV